jgi:predicted Mrr-cat superfamily restriction endonuclease
LVCRCAPQKSERLSPPDVILEDIVHTITYLWYNDNVPRDDFEQALTDNVSSYEYIPEFPEGVKYPSRAATAAEAEQARLLYEKGKAVPLIEGMIPEFSDEE